MRDGTLERIFRKWSVWNDDQPKLYARLLAGEVQRSRTCPAGWPDRRCGPGGASSSATLSSWDAGAALSAVAAAGVGRHHRAVVSVDGAGGRRSACSSPPDACTAPRPIRLSLVGYVELMRGTPILLQLFVLYYGIAAAIRLPAFVAALLGLALNYAAYESEIYRSALEAVSVGQLEAARTLGLSERQVLTLVRGPQAFRLALAPMTNDFVALLKDSSLVSVLTVLELTKQTQIFRRPTSAAG